MSVPVVDSLSCGSRHIVVQVDFSLLGREEIRNYSTVDVTTSSLYTKGLPVPHGLNDLRLGTCDRKLNCATCGNNIMACPGHCGNLDLPAFIFHGAYIEHTLKLLRCVCLECGCVRSRDVCTSLKGKSRFLHISSILRKLRHCDNCNAELPKLIKNGSVIKFCFESSDTEMQILNPGKVYRVFRAISDEDYDWLGFNHKLSRPENLVIDRILVPPPIIRPSVVNESRMRGQDDMTHSLCDLNKNSRALSKMITGDTVCYAADDLARFPKFTEINSSRAADLFERLQINHCTLYNNTPRGPKQAVQRSGTPLKTLKERLVGKEGRLRGTMLGKRVDHSARSVISPNPLLDIDEVGVPVNLCTTLTVPVNVNIHNIKDLTERVRRGANVVGGAACVITKKGNVIDLEHCTMRHKVQLRVDGDIVERYLIDGDWVLFNRQPSLHKGSLMAHRVKLMPEGKTFRMNVTVTGPYNADFDGDEMNMHVPQSQITMAEYRDVMSVQTQMISSQNSKPTFGLVQDALVGAYMLTADDTRLSRPEFCQCLCRAAYADSGMEIPPCAGHADGRQFWTGKQLISCLLPKGLYMRSKNVHIDDGQLIQGRLGKAEIGKASNSIPHIIALDFGSRRAIEFLSDAQKVCEEFACHFFGITCGIKDCFVTDVTENQLLSEFRTANEKIQNIYRSIREDSAVVTKGMRESAVMNLLSNLLSDCGGLVRESCAPDNDMMRMIDAGSKGNSINSTQVMAAVAQCCVDSKRIHPQVEGRNLPCEPHKSTNPLHYGFVINPYSRGLTSTEFVYHAMGGREGLVDTAVKTSVTGYLQRRLTKTMEGVRVEHAPNSQYCILSNGSDMIIDFCYGGDGNDSQRLERCNDRYLLLSDDELRQLCIEKDYAEILIHLRGQVVASRFSPVNLTVSTSCHLPFSISRKLQRCSVTGKSLTPEKYAGIANLALRFCELLLREQGPNMSLNMRWHIMTELSFGAVRNLDVCSADVRQILVGCWNRMRKSRAEPGSMVGCCAAQAVGEPATQMTLNTFHTAGVLRKNVTTGVPRLKEIVDACKSIRLPCVTVHPLSDRLATFFAGRLQQIFLSDCLDVIDVQKTKLTYKLADPVLLHSRHGLRTSDIFFQLMKHVAQHNLPLQHEVKQPQTITFTSNDTDRPFVARYNSSLTNMHIQGLPGVNKSEKRVCKKTTRDIDGSLADRDATVVDLYGATLAQTMDLQGIDWTMTVSNDIHDVYTTLGVEACRTVLLSEFADCFAADGTYIDMRHVSIIADCMTSAGKIIPMSRHGINSRDSHTLQRCSFEETLDVLSDAGLFGHNDTVDGVTASIILGTPPPVGTGIVNLMWRKDFMVQGTCDTLKRLRKKQRRDKSQAPVAEWKPEPLSCAPEVPDVMPTPVVGSESFAPSSVDPFATVVESDSPGYSPDSPGYCPASPGYCPTSPVYASDISADYANDGIFCESSVAQVEKPFKDSSQLCADVPFEYE